MPNNDETQVKRGRGRPKGPSTPKQQDKSLTSIPTNEVAVKKTRGRPKGSTKDKQDPPAPFKEARSIYQEISYEVIDENGSSPIYNENSGFIDEFEDIKNQTMSANEENKQASNSARPSPLEASKIILEKPSNAKESGNHKPPFNQTVPYPIYLSDPKEVDAYYRFFELFVNRYQGRRSSFISRIIQITIKMVDKDSRKLADLDLPVSPSQFISSPDCILVNIWNASMGGTNRLIVVGDNLNEVEYYKYTNSIPTYSKITISELYNIIYHWLQSIFENSIPSEVSTKAFISKFIDLLTTQNVISEDNFRNNYEKLGVPFMNGFLSIEDKNRSLPLIEYSENLFQEADPVQVEYTNPNIKYGKIYLQDHTNDLLKVLTNNDIDKVNIFRGLIRRVLTGRIEGRNYQSGVYISGPPGTGKSFVVEILKSMVPKRYIQEMDKFHNQFSNVQFQNCRLLIVSDLKELSKQNVETLKKILGRDTLSLQRKFINGVGFIEPYLTVIIISNIDLNQFWALKSDQAIVDKLLVWRFTAADQIPPEYQVANLRNFLGMFIPDLVNWAMYAPQRLLTSQIRALGYNALQQGAIENNGPLVHYLIENYWYDPNYFLPAAEVAAHLEGYITLTCDDSLMPLTKKSFTALGGTIQSTCNNSLGVEVVYKRRSTLNEAGVRPMGFHGLRLKANPDENVPIGCQMLVVTQRVLPADLPSIFEANETVSWFSEEANLIISNNKKILAARELRQSTATGPQALSAKSESLKPPKEEEVHDPTTD